MPSRRPNVQLPYTHHFIAHPLEPRRLMAATFASVLTFVPTKDTNQGVTVATDSNNNGLVAGMFRNTTDFDPGPHVTALTPVKDYDVFLAKYTTGGALFWARRIGGPRDDAVSKIVTDPAGNVYVAGYFSKTLSLDNGHGGVFNVPSQGHLDAFVAKYSASGVLVWAESIGGSFDDTATGLAVTSTGSVYFGGTYILKADLNPSPTIYHSFQAVDTQDAYIEKLDSTGHLIWVRTLHGDPTTKSRMSLAAMAVGTHDDLFVTGLFEGPVNFSTNAAKPNIIDGKDSDPYVIHYTSSGSTIWAEDIARTGKTTPKAIAVDKAGNIFTTGQFIKDADFDPGPKQLLLSPKATDPGSIYITKLQPNGSLGWVRTIGNSGSNSIVNDLALDSSGNAYITGGFQDVVDFNPGRGSFVLNASGTKSNNFKRLNYPDGINGFIEKLSNNGTFIFARQVGGSDTSLFSSGITVDAANNIYTTGIFGGPANFNIGGTAISRDARKEGDAYLLKYRQ